MNIPNWILRIFAPSELEKKLNTKIAELTTRLATAESSVDRLVGVATQLKANNDALEADNAIKADAITVKDSTIATLQSQLAAAQANQLGTDDVAALDANNITAGRIAQKATDGSVVNDPAN